MYNGQLRCRLRRLFKSFCEAKYHNCQLSIVNCPLNFCLGFGLDVDLEAGQAGSQTGILTFLADGKAQLAIGDDDRASLLLIRKEGNTDNLSRAQGSTDILAGIFAEDNNVDLLTVEFIHDGSHTASTPSTAARTAILVRLPGSRAMLRIST